MILSNEQSEQFAITDEDNDLLVDIRNDYRYCLDYWREIRQEAAEDMRYVSGDPWSANDRAERNAAGRPVLTPDELSQYLKQANNNLRQNKRAIKVNPKGQGATDKDAERRAAIIRGIEYQSNAQAAYTTGFEQCTESSFGAWRIINEYVGDKDEQEPRIKRIPNQFTVLFDPMAKEADRSDQNICFVLDRMRQTEFGRRWPAAAKKSWSPADKDSASEWFQGDEIIVAEYWKREKVKTDKVRQRQKHKYKVTQYITNGVEVLEKNEWPGSWIPIIGVFGEELYLNDGGQSKLKMYSMIRRARVPQMMMAFIASCEAEEFGMSPKAPFLGWEGMFSGADAEGWKTINKIPRSSLTAVLPDWWKESWGPPPLPTRPQFVPNVAAYEASKESWRRSIQAAMGQTPLPTSAQRQNEKSGVALEKIQTQMAIGSYNFTDNYDRALENTGRQLNELITKVMDTPRQVSTRQPDESHELLHVMPQEHATPEMIQKLGITDDDYLVVDRGEFDVTISTGPSFQSQREEATQFVDLLLQNVQNLPIPPEAKASLIAKGVKLKNIGPMGDEIAKVLDPNDAAEDPIPPQAQAAMAQQKQELQAIDAYAKQKEQEVQKLEFEKQAKVLDNQMKMDIEKLKIEAQVATAEITTKAQSQSERDAIVADVFKQVIGHLQEQDMARMQQGHDQQMQQTGHEQALEQQDQAGQQALTQQQMAQEQSQSQQSPA